MILLYVEINSFLIQLRYRFSKFGSELYVILFTEICSFIKLKGLIHKDHIPCITHGITYRCWIRLLFYFYFFFFGGRGYLLTSYVFDFPVLMIISYLEDVYSTPKFAINIYKWNLYSSFNIGTVHE